MDYLLYIALVCILGALVISVLTMYEDNRDDDDD